MRSDVPADVAPAPFEKADARALLPYPKPDCNKYTRGGLGVVAGSEEYPGAAVLAATAAARGGAGYVRLVVPQPAAPAARCHLTSIPVSSCVHSEGHFCPDSLADAQAACLKMKAALIGPGLGCSEEAQAFARQFAAAFEGPLVMDADALRALVSTPDLLACRAGDAIITPHEGEAARLLGRKVENRIQDALCLAQAFHCVCVLKGPKTLVAAPSGEVRIVLNAGPELAKAGSGDVLAGLAGAFLAQGLQAVDAASLAVYLHGAAGAHAASCMSSISVMPEDLLSSIGPAIVNLEK